ncbi:hypothetical protein pdam_00025898 [Pocillopora damicornis]|uniref:Uncharacterized protein n=1 Tax=Pocillopora damicornis TaxID=46731 RepID=A0A3M6UKQ4_POCDA|nr:hypothetical protein pdam_00025898 [Pocillopora damicornis]
MVILLDLYKNSQREQGLQQKHLEHLRTVFKSDPTFRCHVVRPKDALEPTKQNGVVFKIPCECNRVYIRLYETSSQKHQWG